MTEAERKTRVWAIPPEPSDEVMVLWTRQGQPWVRPLPSRRWYQADPKTLRPYGGKGLAWSDLLIAERQLTDAPGTRPANTQGDAR